MRQKYLKAAVILLLILFPMHAMAKPDTDSIERAIIACYYISSSVGDDNNEGTKEKPLRSIASIKNKKNVRIRLKCGDVFFENIKGFSNSIIETYGKGRNPIICGFRVLSNINAWNSDGDGIWRLDMSQPADFKGFPLSLASDKNRFTDIGCIYDSNNDKIYGHIVNSKNKMKSKGDVFLTEKYKSADIKPETFRYVWFKYDTNPKELGYLCFPVFEHGISSMSGCIVRNIAVVGFARHGMCALNNCLVEECELDIIGGSIQTGTNYWVRYGNGIEFWITKNPIGNTTVKNCMISRTYDCGSTIQGSSNDLGNPSNICFTNNTFVHCRQAFEHFLNSSKTSAQYVNCEFTENLAYMMGDNGFSSPELRDANILSYEQKAKHLKISGNEFYGANYFCGYQKLEGMSNNTVYLFEDQYLVHYHIMEGFPSIYATGENQIREYQEKWGDNSRIIILKRYSKEDLKIRKKFLKRIKYTKPDLKLERIL